MERMILSYLLFRNIVIIFLIGAIITQNITYLAWALPSLVYWLINYSHIILDQMHRYPESIIFICSLFAAIVLMNIISLDTDDTKIDIGFAKRRRCKH
jgi:Na+/glutamate symporter